MKRGAMLLLATLGAAASARGDEHGTAVYVPTQTRPFLLLDARRRYRPQDHAHAYVQRRGGGSVQLALYRVHDARALIEASVSRQGVSVAAGPWGAEAESLLQGASALPRRGARLTLHALREVRCDAPPAPRRAVHDESAAYDSNEEDEGMVETWGVSARGWGVADVDLGALPTGTWLLRAHDGIFATSALLSVGDLVVLMRRGDHRDLVRVSDGEGVGQAGVTIEALGGEIVRARTNSAGEAALPASGVMQRRVYATRGDDLAWTEVSHARLPPCDTRVYLATGRPVYRPGEPVHVRGHIRGCAPVAGARVRVSPTAAGPGGEWVTADEDGNFSATLVAAAELGAEHEGRRHLRTLQLDARAVPRASLRVSLDHAWAVPGASVAVTATPSADAGLRRVRFMWPGGSIEREVVDGEPVRASIVVPPTAATIERLVVSAVAVGTGETVTARASLWTGRHPVLLALQGDEVPRGGAQSAAISLRANDLGGDPAPGRVELALFGSDGNRPQGIARWSGHAEVGGTGVADLRVPLVGAGPWWVRARRGEAVAGAVLWERARPASMSAHGPLALRPERALVAPGESLGVTLRAAGPTWVTLEQGGVWSAQLATPARDGLASLQIVPPAEARGLATLVATRVHEGRVETATAVTEVASATRFTMSAESARRSYPVGATATVIVRTRTIAGAPKPAVLSMWLEDAGWWSLGSERHPAVDDYFRATGRPASAGDSTRPAVFGSEEGRRLDCGMFWNGERLSGTTFRHAWGHGSPLVSFRAHGDLRGLATALARAAGLRGAAVCAARVRSVGRVALEVRSLPWDLAASRLAERTNTWVRRDAAGLRFDCSAPNDLGRGLGGYGTGSGAGGLGGGAGRGAREREQVVQTQWFLAARRIGADGVARVEVPLPSAPGRWRLHALAIADDGAGATVDTDLDTTQPVTTGLRLARALSVGDTLDGVARVQAREALPATARVRVTAEGAARLEAPRDVAAVTDAQGLARVPFRLRGEREGEARVVVEVRDGARVLDALSARVQVRADHAEQRVSWRAVVTERATDVDLPIPPLARAATLSVALDEDLGGAIAEALEALRAPRWQVGALLLDRYASLSALSAAASGLRDASGAALQRSIREALVGAAERLRVARGSDGELASWTQLPGDHAITATALALGAGSQGDWSDAWRALRESAGTARGAYAARLAAALARGPSADRALATALLDRVDVERLDALTFALRAAHALGDSRRESALASRLRVALDRTVSNDRPSPCAGPAWFLCMSREGTRGMVASAARALLDSSRAARPSALRAAAWLSTRPIESRRWSWGSSEADVLALLARFTRATPGGALRATMGGEVLAQGHTRRPLTVTVRGAGTLRLSFDASPGRFTRVRVSGALPLTPPAQPVGTTSLSRTFVDDGRAVELAFALPRDATGVELHVPLSPASELAIGAETPVAQRDPIAGWRELDLPVGDTRARVTRLEDGLSVRFARLRAGPHRVRVPLMINARGDFRAGPAWLRANEDEVWGVTPETTLHVAAE